MKSYTIKFYTITVLSMLAFVITSSVCRAQEKSRAGKLEVSVKGFFLGGTSEIAGWMKVEEDDWRLLSVNIGRNYTEHFNFNAEIIYGSIDVTGTGSVLPAGSSVSGTKDTFLGLLNLDYNILDRPVTPYITVGVGFGESSGSVSWSTGASTSSVQLNNTIGFIYTLGVGGRWDITEKFFTKVSYRLIGDENDSRKGLAVSIGFMF